MLHGGTLLQPVPSSVFTAETKLHFSPTAPNTHAGLGLTSGENSFVHLKLFFGGRMMEASCYVKDGGEGKPFGITQVPPGDHYFRLIRNDHRMAAMHSTNGRDWKLMHVWNWSYPTGKLSVFSFNHVIPNDPPDAKFDYVRLTERVGDIPDATAIASAPTPVPFQVGIELFPTVESRRKGDLGLGLYDPQKCGGNRIVPINLLGVPYGLRVELQRKPSLPYEFKLMRTIRQGVAPGQRMQFSFWARSLVRCSPNDPRCQITFRFDRGGEPDWPTHVQSTVHIDDTWRKYSLIFTTKKETSGPGKALALFLGYAAGAIYELAMPSLIRLPDNTPSEAGWRVENVASASATPKNASIALTAAGTALSQPRGPATVELVGYNSTIVETTSQVRQLQPLPFEIKTGFKLTRLSIGNGFIIGSVGGDPGPNNRDSSAWEVRVFDASKANELRRIPEQILVGVLADNTVVTRNRENVCFRWDVTSGINQLFYNRKGSTITETGLLVALAENGYKQSDNPIVCYETISGREISRFEPSEWTGNISMLRLSRTGTWIGLQEFYSLKFWKPHDPVISRSVSWYTREDGKWHPKDYAISADEGHLLTSWGQANERVGKWEWEGRLAMFNIAGDKEREIWKTQQPTFYYSVVALSHDGRLAACGSSIGEIHVYDARTGTLRATCRAHPAYTTKLAFSPDDSMLASTGDDNKIALWSIK
ncbi:MAG: hypothetical protein ACR2IE_17040 [Candidatus Sumerlaeaceae bacterium]